MASAGVAAGAAACGSPRPLDALATLDLMIQRHLDVALQGGGTQDFTHLGRHGTVDLVAESLQASFSTQGRRARSPAGTADIDVAQGASKPG